MTPIQDITSPMTPSERYATLSLAGIYALRMLGLFMILPVLSLSHTHTLSPLRSYSLTISLSSLFHTHIHIIIHSLSRTLSLSLSFSVSHSLSIWITLSQLLLHGYYNIMCYNYPSSNCQQGYYNIMSYSYPFSHTHTHYPSFTLTNSLSFSVSHSLSPSG